MTKLGTRRSPLARFQAEFACAALERAAVGAKIVVVPIDTLGDQRSDPRFSDIGSVGVFVAELERSLLAGTIDVACHSAKDLPLVADDELVIGAYLPRADPRDALCGAKQLRAGMTIGTSSVRRRAQLLALEPTTTVVPLRGNIETRLRRGQELGLDAVILASAGIDRLGIARDAYRFDPAELLPEPGQGAIALQVRRGEEALVAHVDHRPTRVAVERERVCAALIGGGCSAPVAAFSVGATIEALVAAPDGSWVERQSGSRPETVAAYLLAASRLHETATVVGT